MLLKKANTITTPTAYSNGFLHSVKPEVVWETFYESDFSVPYTGFISNLIGTTGESIAGVNDAIKLTLNNGLANHDIVPILNNVPLLNLDIRLSFDYYIPSTNAQLNGIFNFNTFSSSSHPNLRFQEIDKWTSVVVTGKTVTSGNVDLYFRALSGTSQTFSADGDVFYLKNIKVEIDISADFTFTRNSSATRVNELGYIEDVQIIGGELVSNGDFEEIGSELVTNGFFDTDTAWVKQAGWTISGGTANFVEAGGNRNIYQSILTLGKFYQLTFTISNYVSGSIRNISNPSYTEYSADGTYTEIFSPTTYTNLFLNCGFGSELSIDNVSVKEVGQDWSFGTGWTMGNGKAIVDGTNTYLEQASTIQPSTLYRVSFTLSDYVSGNFRIALGGYVVGNVFNSNGTYTADVISDASSNTRIYFYAQNASNFVVDNISVKKITTDTNLPRINYEGFTYAESLGDNLVVNGTFDTDSNWSKLNATISGGQANINVVGGAFSYIFQNISYTSGKTYRVKIQVQGTSGYNIRFQDDTSNTGGFFQIVTLDGTQQSFSYDFTANANSDVIQIARSSSSGDYSFSIDNVSVQEVIGDLPVPYSGKGHLLLEPQRSNIAYKGGGLSLSGASQTSNFGISPSGDNDSTKLEATVSGTSYVRTANPSTVGTLACSVFVKKGIGDYIQFLHAASATHYANYDLVNGVVTAEGSATTASIESYGDWLRLIAVFDSVTLSSDVRCYLSDNPNASYGGASSAVGNYIEHWGFQTEEGDYATSYIANTTPSTTVTRLGETCNNATHSFPSEGVLYAEIAALANDGLNRSICISDGSTSNRINILFATADNNIRTIVLIGGVTSSDHTEVVSDFKEFNKIALRYKQDEFTTFINGVQVDIDLSGNTFSAGTMTQLSFNVGNGSLPFYGKTKMVATFPYLSNDEMECLTGEGYGTFEALAAAYSYTIK